MKRVLTIAGSDSGGGAGIQADLKAITVLGAYGLSVITALTAQNTLGVEAVHLSPPEFVAAQLDAVLGDIGADAAKTGMLATAGIIEVVADRAARYGLARLVVDPVMVAKSGQALIDEPAKTALRDRLLPLAFLVTPNIPEAEELTGLQVADEADMARAARKIHQMGPQNVLLKGGHLAGQPVDLLFDGRTIHRFPGARIESKNTHGTGCTLSAALATFLAQGLDLVEAVGRAKEFISLAITRGLSLGRGHGPTNPLAWLEQTLARGEILERLAVQVARLEAAPLARFIPEISSQLVFALPGARGPEQVAGQRGRIVKFGPGVKAVGCSAFGASRHVAKVVLAAMGHDPELRSGMALAFEERTLEACRRLGLKVGSFDRAQEPREVKEREGSSLEWGTDRAFRDFGRLDVVFDRGEKGKEPVIRLLGRDPEEVVDRLFRLREALEEV